MRTFYDFPFPGEPNCNYRFLKPVLRLARPRPAASLVGLSEGYPQYPTSVPAVAQRMLCGSVSDMEAAGKKKKKKKSAQKPHYLAAVRF